MFIKFKEVYFTKSRASQDSPRRKLVYHKRTLKKLICLSGGALGNFAALCEKLSSNIS